MSPALFAAYRMNVFQPFGGGSDYTSTNISHSEVLTNNVSIGASTSQDHPFVYTAVEAAVVLRVTFAFLTIIVGTIGNGLSLMVMCQKGMRGTAAATYLSAIAVVDTLVVYFGQIPEIVRYYMPEVSKLVNAWHCALRPYCLYTAGDVAVWMVLALTVDRYIAVCRPQHSKQLCTQQRAVKVICGLLLFALLKNLSVPVAYVPGSTSCLVTRPWLEVYMRYVRPWGAFILYALIPVTSVLVLNLLIIRRLVQVHQSVKTSGTSGGPQSISSLAGSSLTAMFLSVSIFFLVLLTPSMLNYAIMAHRSPHPYDKLITAIFDSLAYINHSINFFLYCLTGRRFRKEFLRLVSKVYYMNRRGSEDGPSRPTTIDFGTFGTSSNLE